MSNMLAAGMATLGQKMKDFGSTLVTYRRGAFDLSLYATIGRQLLRTLDRAGNTKTELTDRDFTFQSADLVIDTVQATPEDGDTIDVVFGTVTKRFTVMPIGSEKSWRYSDEQGETVIRVHTKYTRDV